MAKSGKERNKKGVMRSLPRHVQAWREAEEKKRKQGMVVDDRPKFTYVEHDVCDDPNIGANAKYVYMMLSRCCDFDTKDVAMKRQELADYVGFSLPILDEALRELRDAGYVEAIAQYEDNEQIENRWVVCGPWRKYQERKLREVLERMEADPSLGLGELGMDVRLLKNLVGGVLKNLEGPLSKNLEAPLPKKLGSESLLDSLLDSLKDSTLLSEQPDAVAEVQAGAAEVSASVPKPEVNPPGDANEEIIIGVVELSRQQYSSLVQKAAERYKDILAFFDNDPELYLQWCFRRINVHYTTEEKGIKALPKVKSWYHVMLNWGLGTGLEQLEKEQREKKLLTQVQLHAAVREEMEERLVKYTGRRSDGSYPPEADELLEIIRRYEAALASRAPDLDLEQIERDLEYLRVALERGWYHYRPGGSLES